MTREEAEEYAKVMSYREAVYNASKGKCIPYHKATLIKLYELMAMIESKESRTMKQSEIEELERIGKSISGTEHFLQQHPDLKLASFQFTLHQLVLLDRIITVRLLEEKL